MSFEEKPMNYDDLPAILEKFEEDKSRIEQEILKIKEDNKKNVNRLNQLIGEKFVEIETTKEKEKKSILDEEIRQIIEEIDNIEKNKNEILEEKNKELKEKTVLIEKIKDICKEQMEILQNQIKISEEKSRESELNNEQNQKKQEELERKIKEIDKQIENIDFYFNNGLKTETDIQNRKKLQLQRQELETEKNNTWSVKEETPETKKLNEEKEKLSFFQNLLEKCELNDQTKNITEEQEENDPWYIKEENKPWYLKEENPSLEKEWGESEEIKPIKIEKLNEEEQEEKKEIRELNPKETIDKTGTVIYEIPSNIVEKVDEQNQQNAEENNEIENETQPEEEQSEEEQLINIDDVISILGIDPESLKEAPEEEINEEESTEEEVPEEINEEESIDEEVPEEINEEESIEEETPKEINEKESIEEEVPEEINEEESTEEEVPEEINEEESIEEETKEEPIGNETIFIPEKKVSTQEIKIGQNEIKEEPEKDIISNLKDENIQKVEDIIEEQKEEERLKEPQQDFNTETKENIEEEQQEKRFLFERIREFTKNKIIEIIEKYAKKVPKEDYNKYDLSMITYGHVDGIDGRVYYLINDQYNDSIEDLLNGKSDYFVVDGSIGREKIEKFIKENIRKVKKIIKENAMKIAHKVKRKTTLEKQNANKEKGKKYLENIITKKQQNQLKEDIVAEKIDIQDEIQEEPIDKNKTFECPNCHAMNYEDSAFCEKCARILKYEEETSNERKY